MSRGELDPMQLHWSDWFALGLMVGIAIFMTGWYVRDHVSRRRERQSSGADTTDVTA